MNKKEWLLIFVALVFAGVYAVYFTNWFTPKIIHVTSTNMRGAAAIRGNADNGTFLARLSNLANSGGNVAPATIPIQFKLAKPCKLTDIKVIDLDEWQTNKNCVPLWHLVAYTNTRPVGGLFHYGDSFAGMKPLVPGAVPQPLKPGVHYRLLLSDGTAKGQHDFQPVAAPPAPVIPAAILPAQPDPRRGGPGGNGRGTRGGRPPAGP